MKKALFLLLLPGREYRYASLARGTYRLVFSAALGKDRERRYTLAVEFAVREDGSGGYTGTFAEAKALIRDYSRRLGEAAVWPEEVLQRKSWAYAYPMLLMGRDLYVGRWTVEQTRLGARVTVHRDLDLPRAEALLEGLSGLVVLRGEDFSPKLSPVTETNQGTGGTLRAELIPQTDPELYREGAWLLTPELREGTQTDFYWCRNLWVERRDLDTGQWYALGYSGGYLLYETERTVYLEAGDHPLTVLSLGEFDAEFPPGEEYRFVLAFDTRPGTGDTLEYYICPFVVTAQGEA